MANGRKKLVIWDVDGTLVDSRASIHRGLQDAAVVVGLAPPSYDEVRQIVGLSLIEAITRMRPQLSHDMARKYAAAYKEVFLRFHAEPGFHEPLYAGAEACLADLKAEGWLIGMATGKSRRGVNRNMEIYGWWDIFDATFCADDGPSKPHPHMIESNMRVLGVRPGQTVMVGDTAHDISMALNAGVQAIGVSWGFHTAEELQQAGAQAIVHDFAELKQVLQAFTPLELV